MATQKETIVDHFDRDVTADILNDIAGSLDILKLRYCRLSQEKWKQLANKDDFREAQQLILDYTDLHNNVDGLAACIVNKKVRKLSLINTRVTKDDLELLEKELSTLKSSQILLHSLNLMHNRIEPGGFEVLAKILNLMPVGKEVDATNCKLTDGAIKSFHSTISKEKHIRSLILSQNDQITPEGMVYVGKIAEKCKTKSLGLSCCCLEDEHLRKIMETSPENLTRLDLSDNMKLSAQTVTKLSQNWRSLEKIDVRECWLSAEDVTLLQKNIEPCQVISDNPSSNDEEEITWTAGIDYESVPSDVDFGESEPEEDTLTKPEIKSIVEESTPAGVRMEKTFHHKTTVDLYNSDITEDTLNEAVGFLDTVHLRCCRLNRNFWKQLVNNDKFIEIRQLILVHTDLHNNVDGLAECIVNKKVRILSLINTRITKDDLKRFDKELALEDDSEILLHSLNLMLNKIEPGGFEVLAKILNLMPVVEEFSATDCNLNDEALKTFHSAISEGKDIRSFILGQYDQITPKGMPFVGKIAKKCNTKKLGLAGSRLEDEHLRKIMETSPESLMHLELSFNTELSTQAVAELAQMWNHLETIDVTQCHFSTEAIKELQENIKPCKVIFDKYRSKGDWKASLEMVDSDYKSKSQGEIESEEDPVVDLRKQRFQRKEERKIRHIEVCKPSSKDDSSNNAPHMVVERSPDEDGRKVLDKPESLHSDSKLPRKEEILRYQVASSRIASNASQLEVAPTLPEISVKMEKKRNEEFAKNIAEKFSLVIPKNDVIPFYRCILAENNDEVEIQDLKEQHGSDRKELIIQLMFLVIRKKGPILTPQYLLEKVKQVRPRMQMLIDIVVDEMEVRGTELTPPRKDSKCN